MFEDVINAIHDFPAEKYGLEWVDVHGQRVFSAYNISGALEAACWACLIKDRPLVPRDFGREFQGLQQLDGGKWIVLEFIPTASREQVLDKISKAVELLNA